MCFIFFVGEANFHDCKHNYEFGEGEFQNVYLGKQYFKFGKLKFLKLKEVSITILGEAIF